MRKLKLLFLLVGLGALSWMIYRVGPSTLLDGILAIGFGFILTCTAHLGGLLLDSVTLRSCAGREGAPPYLHFARASISGHAINEATPFGKVGEITKYSILREKLPAERAAGALVAQNICMFVVNCGLIALGAPVAYFVFETRGPAAVMFWVASGVFLIAGSVGLLILRRGLGGWPFLLLRHAGLGRFRPSKARVQKWREGWRKVETAWRATSEDRKARDAAWASAIASRMCNVLETALILYFLGGERIIAAAVLSLGSSQMVGWLFSFVPLGAGSAEGGAWVVFSAAGLPPELGVLVEIGRKLRRIAFITLGVTVLGWDTFRAQRRAE